MANKNQLTFNDILDQPEAVEGMRTIAKSDSSRFNHNGNTSLLFTGPSGTGKTFCANVLHNELGNDEFLKFNSEGFNKSDLYKCLFGHDKDNGRITVFLDEAHALDKKIQNILLTAVSEGFVNSPKAEQGRSYPIPVAPFTLILATTHEYKLIEALRNRMTMIIKLSFYNNNALSRIVLNYVHSHDFEFENESLCRQIAERAKNTPRLAVNRIASMAMRVAAGESRDIITDYDLKQAFRLLKIDHLGLNSDERCYLECLAKNQRVKRNILSSMTGLPAQTISEVIEPYLLRKELIYKDGNERVITKKGRTHIKIYRI
jgi:Holliday junction DNA helicase RuvB